MVATTDMDLIGVLRCWSRKDPVLEGDGLIVLAKYVRSFSQQSSMEMVYVRYQE